MNNIFYNSHLNISKLIEMFSRLSRFVDPHPFSADIVKNLMEALTMEQLGQFSGSLTKVHVFYCLMKKFKSLNFYHEKIFSLILTNLDQTHRDLLKIMTKNFW